MTEQEAVKEYSFNITFLKKNWKLILLVLLVLFGAYLRCYHINYPVIGYHNMKEVHYLTEARNFARGGFFKYGFFTPAQDYPYVGQDITGAHADTFPTISILVALLFKLFGYSLALARSVGIFFTTASIVLVYLIVKKIFESERMAFVAATLTAINPLFVFFSHNVQLIHVSLFFMLLALLLSLYWWETKKSYYLMASAAALAIATLTKYPFLIIVIPMIGAAPFKTELSSIKKISSHLKENIKTYLASFMILLTVPLWMLYNSFFIAKEYGRASATLSLIEPGYIFQSKFFTASLSFIRDNYTLLGFVLFLFATVVTVIMFFKNRSRANIFLLSCAVALIPYLLIMARKITKHSYHHYPIAPLIIILIAYFIVLVSNSLGNILKNERQRQILKIIIIIIFLLLLYGPSKAAWTRQFNTQFYGLDVAGEYINEHKLAGETLIHSGHQAFGILWHSDIKGMRGGLNSLENLQTAEQELNGKWLFIYNWDFDIINDPEMWPYIEENYALEQAGFVQVQEGLSPLYFLLRKSNIPVTTSIDEQLQQGKSYTHYYELTSGKVPITVIEIE